MSGSVPVRPTSTGAATVTQLLARGTPDSPGRTAASHTRMTSRSPDRRTRKTQAALHNALITLLNGKPLDQITITELTRQADVNRATFYAHYSNVYDLFRHVEEDFMRGRKEPVTLMAGLAANTTLAAGIGVFEQNLHILQPGR